MERNAYFDNAKFILIYLVVFGHMIQSFKSDQVYIRHIYTWIYTFHMPVFIFVSGFFAKGATKLSYIKKLAQKLIIPYIIFQTLYTVYYFLIGQENWLVDSIFYPQWSLWFLMSLFCWHVLLIVYKKIEPKYSLTIAFVLGIVVGYFDQVGHMFSLSRTIVFFPYFLLGYILSEKQVMKLKRKNIKIIALITMVLVFLLVIYLPDIPTGLLFQSKPYSDLGLEIMGGIARLGVYLLGIMMGAAVLAWIPRNRYWFTKLGTRTMTVYLFHGFFVQIIRHYDIFTVHNLIDLLILAIISFMIVLLLSGRVNCKPIAVKLFNRHRLPLHSRKRLL